MTLPELIALIDEKINMNGIKSISGPKLNEVCKAIVNNAASFSKTIISISDGNPVTIAWQTDEISTGLTYALKHGRKSFYLFQFV